MPVTPYRIHPFQGRKDLYQFLSVFQQKSVEKNRAQIATFCLEIDPIDPLAILQEMARPDQVHFYLEKPFEHEAIAAIGTATSLETSGQQRFAKIQDFLEQCADQFTTLNFASLLVQPRFFCTFTFFDETEPEASFPAARVFLPRWQVLQKDNRTTVLANLLLHPNRNLEQATEELWQEFQIIQRVKFAPFQLAHPLHTALKNWQILDSNNFQTVVQSALHCIHQKHLNKLVLAHAIDVVARMPFDWVYSLHHLRQVHPDCYIFSTSNGSNRSFIGASPERLLRVHNQLLETDALAGSFPRGQTTVEDANLAQQLLSSQKERHEHQLVVDFICDRLHQLGLVPQFAPVPVLFPLSNIQHLHTPIRATLPTHLHPLQVLAELHPTPAVAGLPRDVACQEIKRYEGFGRSLYAAPLGWIDLQGNAEFIVGIRSALIDQHRARLYAGAGIVVGSDPQRELAEIKLKFQALLNALV
ncbi:MAG TPA: isochorismate synthase [Synechococcales cyanobacterium M55_K2018_004]|nr:isochorismate synthase [Synechococcales cyanobacterium M55_K2018_004]